MQIKGYDEWLWRQADEYMSQGDYDEEEEQARIEYEEAKAEALYEEYKERYGRSPLR